MTKKFYRIIVDFAAEYFQEVFFVFEAVPIPPTSNDYRPIRVNLCHYHIMKTIKFVIILKEAEQIFYLNFLFLKKNLFP